MLQVTMLPQWYWALTDVILYQSDDCPNDAVNLYETESAFLDNTVVTLDSYQRVMTVTRLWIILLLESLTIDLKTDRRRRVITLPVRYRE